MNQERSARVLKKFEFMVGKLLWNGPFQIRGQGQRAFTDSMPPQPVRMRSVRNRQGEGCGTFVEDSMWRTTTFEPSRRRIRETKALCLIGCLGGGGEFGKRHRAFPKSHERQEAWQ